MVVFYIRNSQIYFLTFQPAEGNKICWWCGEDERSHKKPQNTFTPIIHCAFQELIEVYSTVETQY